MKVELLIPLGKTDDEEDVEIEILWGTRGFAPGLHLHVLVGGVTAGSVSITIQGGRPMVSISEYESTFPSKIPL